MIILKLIGDAFNGSCAANWEKDTPDFTLDCGQRHRHQHPCRQDHGPFSRQYQVLIDGYDTEALSTIWAKPEEFSAAAQKLVD